MNGKQDVWAATEEFRQRYTRELSNLPVDILTVVEIQLKLDVIPFPGLFRKYSVDAAVLPNFSGIYVDKESYLALEGTPRWVFNRLRFSLAHELGHIVLHRHIAGDRTFRSLEDFFGWSRAYQSSRYTLEWEANEFAGRLLVPAERLKRDFDKFATDVRPSFPAWWTNEDLRKALCRQLSETYGVHPDTIGIRLDREEFWPSS